MNRRIVITGLGAITPLGNDVKTTWQNLINGKSGVGPITRFNPLDYKLPPDFPLIAGEIKNFEPEKWGIDRKIARRNDPFILYALAAVKEAITNAKLNLQKENLSRVGVQIGSGIGGLTTWEEQYRLFLEKGADRVSPFFIPSFIINMASGVVSIVFGLKGPNLASVSACASGAHAIGEAFNKIRLGQVDIMIAGGSEAAITPLGLAGFYQMKALSRRNDAPEKASRPFDKNRDGFVLAEGAGVIVLEEMQHAFARGADFYAELVGFGMSADAFHIAEPSVEGQSECMKAALKDKGLSDQSVDYINAHGTATPLGDISETKAIKEVFGEKKARLIPISSTKSMTGHLLGAAGGLEAIIAVMTIKEGIIPPTINLEDPDPECDLDYVPNTARKVEVSIALSNSFGFGGCNACLVFKRFEK